MRTINIITFSLLSAVAFSSCIKSRGNNTGLEYAPDMVDSKGYEPYNQIDSNLINPYGMNMREPVKGTIAQGQMDYYYPYANNNEGYEAAGAGLQMPTDLKDEEGRGKYNYGIYCAPCHGLNGGNDGKVMDKVGKPVWPNYQDAYIKTLPVGKIYHTLTYGKNNMGSHASVLSPADRWKVIKYVKELSGSGSNTTDSSVNQTNQVNR
jgi:mono/diheme cytochrome c family protein